MSGFIVVIIPFFMINLLLCKALWITIVYEMCNINKLALPWSNTIQYEYI